MDNSNTESSSLDDFKRSFVLIVIDTHESMFIKDDKQETPFSVALKACYSLADSLLLVQNRRDYCQFAIYLAEGDSNKASLIDFKSNIIDSIKILKQKAKLSQDELKDTYMRKDTFDLASFLSFCKKNLITTSSTFHHRKIIYITKDQDPVRGNSQKKLAALNEVKTFNTNSITFQLITMKDNFKYDVFYNDLFPEINDQPVAQLAKDKDNLFEKLSSIIVTRITQQGLKFYPSRKNKTRYIRVVRKLLVKTPKLLNNTRLSKDGKLLKRHVKGGTHLSNKFFLKTHSDIVLSSEDHAEVRDSEYPVGLTLLYVSRRLTEVGTVVRRSELIDFDESSTENANICRNVFSKFWQYCQERGRVLVCACKISCKDHVHFVELVPKFAHNRKLFLMVHIPCLSERMQMPPEEEDDDVTLLTGKRKKVVKALVDTLTFDYEPRSFPDPCYAKKQAYIKSKLLDEPIEAVCDDSVHDMDERITDVVSDFKKSFNLDIDTNPKKRKKPQGRTRSKKK